MGFAMIKIVSPPCWGYQWKIPGVRVNVGGIPGGKHQKLGEKRGFSGGVNAKKMEIPGESGKIWLEIQRGVELQKNWYPQQGGGQFLSGSPIIKPSIMTNYIHLVYLHFQQLVVINGVFTIKIHWIGLIKIWINKKYTTQTDCTYLAPKTVFKFDFMTHLRRHGQNKVVDAKKNTKNGFPYIDQKPQNLNYSLHLEIIFFKAPFDRALKS